ncbi:MAG: hypothetical protein UU93_C0034G0011, partial [Candidatus Amesbacteria bacterium GW2011_GWA2_42_12]
KALEGEMFETTSVPLLDEYHLPHTAVFIDNMVRALTPWPGVWTMKNEKRVKVLEGKMDEKKFIPLQTQKEGKTPSKHL